MKALSRLAIPSPRMVKPSITAQHTGRVRVEGRKVIVSYEQRESEEYDIPSTSRLLVKDGEHVEAGEALTEGSLNPHTILEDQRSRCLRDVPADRNPKGVPCSRSEHQ